MHNGSYNSRFLEMLSSQRGVRRRKGHCSKSPPESASLTQPEATRKPRACRAVCQGSELGSGRSPDCPGSSKKEGKPSPRNILGLSLADRGCCRSQAGSPGNQTPHCTGSFVEKCPGVSEGREGNSWRREKADAGAADPDPQGVLRMG